MHEDRKSEELFGPVFPIPNIIGSFFAPVHTVLDHWMEDYRQYPEVFTYLFNPTTRELKDEKRQHFKYGRLWADDKIVVPKNRIQEIILAHHDPIVAGNWGQCGNSSQTRSHRVTCASTRRPITTDPEALWNA